MPLQPPNKQRQSTEGIAAEDKQKLAAAKAKFCPVRLPLVKHLFIKSLADLFPASREHFFWVI